MGGGDAKKKEDGKDSSDDVLTLELACEYKQIPVSAVNLRCSLLAKVTASAQNNEDKRAPVTICAAIDRSASMKDNLPLLKDTIKFMITQLRAEDRLCIVTFDHEVKVDLPVTNMDAAGKTLAERAVANIKERGHTNLSGGLIAALQALYAIPAEQASLVESVVLFSDGKANYGITDSNGLAKATKSLLEQIGRQACVFTLGYGKEHDPDMLHAIANSGGGIFYYIENKDNIPDSFCDCLGGLLSVAAQNIRLTFSPPNNSVTLYTPLTSFPMKQMGQSHEVIIPDIYHDEEKAIPVKVLLASTCEKESTVCALTCSLEYFDVVQCRSIKVQKSVNIELSESVLVKPIESSFVGDIKMQILRCEIVKSLVRATELADNGNIAGARELLNQCKKLILECPTSTVLTQHLFETIEESLAGLEDKVVYKHHGKPMMMQYLHSHSQQRSSSNPSKKGYLAEHSTAGASPFTPALLVDSNPYTNHAKKALKVKFAQAHKK